MLTVIVLTNYKWGSETKSVRADAETLYTVRSFSYAKDFTNKQKQHSSNQNKALRKGLKKTASKPVFQEQTYWIYYSVQYTPINKTKWPIYGTVATFAF